MQHISICRSDTRQNDINRWHKTIKICTVYAKYLICSHLYNTSSMPALGAFSQNYITPLWTSKSAAAAASRLVVRQLKGRTGADSAASYVEFPGQCASRLIHRVELHSWPASSRPVAVPPRLYDAHPTTCRLVPCGLTHRSCCCRYAYTGQCRGPRLHVRPSTAGAAGRMLLPGPTI